MKAKQPRKFTLEQLKELVKQKKSIREMAIILNSDRTVIVDWLRHCNIKLYNYHNELKFDNKVWDYIDTEEKAYWLGFFFADGNVSSTKNTIELCLQASDIGHVQKFNIFMKHKTKILKIEKTGCSNGKNNYERVRWSVTDKHIKEILVSYGCVPKKSLILKFPNINIFKDINLIRHFIRGYFDGDGCICIKNKNGYPTISMLATKDFMLEVFKYWGYSSNMHINNKNNPNSVINCSFSGVKAQKILKYMYENSTIYLDRKYKLYKIAVQWRNSLDYQRAKTVKAEMPIPC